MSYKTRPETSQEFATRIHGLETTGLERVISTANETQLLIIAALRAEFENSALAQILETTRENIDATFATSFRSAVDDIRKNTVITPSGAVTFVTSLKLEPEAA